MLVLLLPRDPLLSAACVLLPSLPCPAGTFPFPAGREAGRSGPCTLPAPPPFIEPRLGLGPHLSLSPSSRRSWPSPRQVMLCCREESK